MCKIIKKKGPKALRLKPKICKNCAIVFQPKGCEFVYCSDKCFREHRAIREVNCKECNKVYKPIDSRGKGFCSLVCYDLFRHKRGDIGKKQPPKGTKINCRECSIEFEPYRNESKYCSNFCRLSYQKKQRSEKPTIKQRENWRKFGKLYNERKKAVMIDKITLVELIKRDSSVCHICNSMTSCKYNKNNKYSPTIDHVKPLTKGGLHSWDNVKLAHLSCNSRKRNKHNG